MPERRTSRLDQGARAGVAGISRTKSILAELKLHSVCQEAACPNIGECFSHRTATFMLMGDVCTRNCPYCAVIHGRVRPLDADEPRPHCRRCREARPAARGGDLGESRRPARWWRRALRRHRARNQVDAPLDARRSSGARFPGLVRERRDRRRVADRHLQPQHRDSAEAVQNRAPRRPLRTVARRCCATRRKPRALAAR